MANIILNTDDLTLTIEERGDVNTASNVGSGADIFKQKVGTDLEFRGINGGTNINATVNGDNIDVSMNITADMVPNSDNSLDLGSDAKKWAQLYVEDFKLIHANGRGEVTSPTGIYWQTVDGNFEIDATDNDLVLRTDASNRVHIINNLVVDGDLDVNGALTTIDTTNLQIEDAIIELNRGNNGADTGVIIQRGTTGDNAVILWDESADKFKLGLTTATATATDVILSSTASLDVNNLEVDGYLNVDGLTSMANNLNMNGNSVNNARQVMSNDTHLDLKTYGAVTLLELDDTIGMRINSDFTATGSIQANGGINGFTMNGNLDLNGYIINGVDKMRSHDTRLDLSTLGDTTYLQIDDTNGVSTNGWLSTTSNLTVGGSALLQGGLAMGGNNITDVPSISSGGTTMVFNVNNTTTFMEYNNGVNINDSLTVDDQLIVTEITTPQFANASTPRVKVTGDWSNPAHVASLGGVDISGSLLMGAANLSGFTNSLPNSAMEYTTPNGHSFLIVGAQDDNGDDDAGHNAMILVRGESNVIRSSAEAGLPTGKKPLSIEADTLTLDTNFGVDINNALNVTHTGTSSLTIRPDYSTASGDVLSLVRRNAEDGVNDSSIADGSEVKFNFNVRSADGTADQLVAGFQAVTHSIDGNSVQITLDNQAQTAQANTLALNETYVYVQQPIQYPSFTTTERNAMSPNPGWVLFNSSTSKLQVYDGTSWVDLH